MIKKFASTKIFKYLISGVLAFAVDYGALTMCLMLFHIGTGVSAAAGLTCGVFVSFSLNRTWTFKSKMSAKVYRQFISYWILVGINYVFTILMLVMLDEIISVLILKPIIAVIIAAWNFFICKHIIFKHTNDVP